MDLGKSLNCLYTDSVEFFNPMTYSYTDHEQIEEFSNFDLIDEMNECLWNDAEYDDLAEGLPLDVEYDF